MTRASQQVNPSGFRAAGSTASGFLAANRVAIAIGLTSFASLLLELALTRLFSVVLFYHFAFLAISVALLGLGAGGVFAHLRREWLLNWSVPKLGQVLGTTNAVVLVLVLEVVLHLPISLELSGANFLKLTVLYLASAVPFFFTGLLFSVVFARMPEHTGLYYAADLGGGAAACMAIVPLLDLTGAPNAVLCAGMATAAAAWLWSEDRTARMFAVAMGAALLLLAAANHSGKLIDVVYAKGLRREHELWARWNAISRVEVDQDGQAKYIVIDADASTAIMNVDPHGWHGTVWQRDLMAAAPAVANVLRPTGDFAIIGPGGGVDVLRAVANGSKDVTGIEINPIIANTIMRGEYAGYAYHLYEIPEVHLHVQDGRSFVRGSTQRYDVVQMTLVDTWASTAAGAFALSENSLYTVEAFREYFDHLKPDGFIAITRWEFKKPREALRVVSQAMEALHQLGTPDPRLHFIVVADGGLDEDGRPVAVLAKKSPFTLAEQAAVLRHTSANPHLVPLYLPFDVDGGLHTTDIDLALDPVLTPKAASTEKLVVAPAQRTSNAFRDLIASNDPAGFAAKYAYNVSPVSDNKPFFFFTLKTGDVLRNISAGTGHGMDWRVNLGTVVLGMVLLISLAAVAAFLVFPMWLGSGSSGSAASLAYFVAVGLGYILVEIALIQRFVLFLGHPTYALTVVVFLMLLSSGAGSYVARGWTEAEAEVRLRRVFAAIVTILAVYLVVMLRALPGLVGLPFTVKLLVSAGLLVPLGFAMGMPFPTGLRMLSSGAGAGSGSGVEWAWAMNAAASVLGSVLAMVIAIHFGLTVTLASGAVAYLAAASCTSLLRRAALPSS